MAPRRQEVTAVPLTLVEVLAIRQVGHERDQRLAPVPEAVPGAANYVPQGIERPDTRVHLARQIATRESLIAGDRERERVKLPFFRKSVGGNAALRFQVVPQPRARQGREEQRVQDVYAVVGGRNGDWSADAGLVGIQPHDERTDDQYLVALDATHGLRHVPAVEQIEFLADLLEVGDSKPMKTPAQPARAASASSSSSSAMLIVTCAIQHLFNLAWIMARRSSLVRAM